MKINSPKVVLLFLISAIFLSGCASGMYGGGGQQVPPIPTTITGEDGVTISVTPSFWPWEPKNLSNYVTPYYINITNNSDKTIIIDYDDIVLFDQNKTQYTPISPDTVASIFNTPAPSTTYQGGSSYPQLSVGVGFGFGGGYGRRGYGYRGYRGGYGPRVGIYGYSPVYYSPPPVYYSKPVNTSDILTQALSLGPVHPGATITGFLYFRDTIAQASQVTLDIGYNVEGSNRETVLTFPFDLTLRN